MRIKFWGTRGSIPKPGPATARYGGNTSCVEVRSDAGTLIVLDCGTGAHGLGQALLREADRSLSGHILISHTHWDHIQGIPFFDPLFMLGHHWDIYGPKGLSGSIREALSGQMQYTYFPITIERFEARVGYHDLVEGSFRIGDVRITTHYLNHPALTLGYRIEADGACLVYACDHEPHAPELASGQGPLTGRDRFHVEFLNGADLVIHDAQYVAREYPEKIRWGHSTVEYALRVCEDAGVRQLAMTHYDPLRDDDAVDAIVADTRARLADSGSKIEFVAAAEGMTIELSGSRQAAAATPPAAPFPARTTIDAEVVEAPVLLLVPDPEMRAVLCGASAKERLPLITHVSAAALLQSAAATKPSLIIVQHQPGHIDGISVARTLHALAAEQADPTPIVLVAAQEADAIRDSDAAGEWLVKPFSESFARSKLKAWVLRSACRWMRARPPIDESARLAALARLSIMDTAPEPCFDRITRIAAYVFNVPIALVSFVDAERQWFKSRVGITTTETPRDTAFCSHVVERNADLLVPDTLLDDRFADNPLVVDRPRVRFYAGAPLALEDGSCLGSFCLLDTRPREFSAAEVQLLHDFRDWTIEEITRQRLALAPQ